MAGSLVSHVAIISAWLEKILGLLTSSFPPAALLALKGPLLKEVTLEESTKLTIQSIQGLDI